MVVVMVGMMVGMVEMMMILMIVTNVLVQFSLVTQLCLTLCFPMDCNMPGFPFHHQLLELTQIHVHQVSDARQPSHPLSSPSVPP